VLSLFSRRRNWDSPTPSAAGECAPPPFGPGVGAHTRLRERSWGSPNSDDGTHTVVLYVNKYFVCLIKELRKQKFRNASFENLFMTQRIYLSLFKWQRNCQEDVGLCFMTMTSANGCITKRCLHLSVQRNVK
jgi:hypothetical protein